MEQVTTTAAQIAARVASAIESHGVTIVWLCEKTGIPRTTMHRRLAGHSPFNVNELHAIATALRIPPTELLAVAS